MYTVVLKRFVVSLAPQSNFISDHRNTMETMAITYKTGSGTTIHRHEPSVFAVRALAGDIQSIRKPTSYKNQRHLPGYFWMSRMRTFVAYESRLEMTILLQLDFNRQVAHVVSQPFLLHYEFQANRYQHFPDFFVRYSNGVGEVINVKPRQFVHTEKNKRDFTACDSAAIAMGFAYSTLSEMDRVYLANLKWLAAYRRVPVGLGEYRRILISVASKPVSIAQATRAVPGLPALVKPVLFHLIWIGDLAMDMYKRLTDQTKIHASNAVRNP